MSGKENGDRQPLVITSLLMSIHVSTFYFNGAVKGRLMLIECPKYLLSACFCPILAPWGVREDADHTAQQGLSFRAAADDRPRADVPAPLTIRNGT